MTAAARIIGQHSSDFRSVYIEGKSVSVSRTQRRDSVAHLQLLSLITDELEPAMASPGSGLITARKR